MNYPIIKRHNTLLFISGLCLFLSNLSIADNDLPKLKEELRPITPETVDARFFELIDLNTPGLEKTRVLVEKKEYAKALEAWRDYVVKKLRPRKEGKFRWHGNKLNRNYAKNIQIVLGKEKDPKEPEDTAGIDGPPRKDRKINWLDPNARFRDCYPGSRNLDGMVAQYQHTRNPELIGKWFEIANDFCVNQKKMERTLSLKDRSGKLTYPRSRNAQGTRIQWDVRNAQIDLDAAGRVQSILKSLSYLAKALPDGNKIRDWNKESMTPIDTPLSPEAIKLIPADSLANIAISLYYDHAPFLLEAYGKQGRAPNQRFSGLIGLGILVDKFKEFKIAKKLDPINAKAFKNYLDTTTLQDGGDMEQSFNYNRGLIEESNELLSTYPEGAKLPKWLQLLKQAVLKRERLFAGVTTPLGNTPKTGTNGGGRIPAAIWKDSKTQENWRKIIRKETHHPSDPTAKKIYNNLLGTGKKQPLPFTSVAFPYSGYYALRDGWKMDSLYLWLMGSRRGHGHRKENINGIAITAYGRNLIVDAGPPPYTPGFLPESQKKDFKAIIEYFGEKSSYSTNTILVDMQSQRRHCIPAPRQAYQTPIAVRWHNSKNFDLAESSYEDGYGQGSWKSKASINVKHYRQVIFLRNQEMWLVTDRLTGDGKPHKYQQQWHFPPPMEQWGVKSPGFLKEQVTADNNSKTIRTNDPNGPNIELHQFSPEKLDYRSYFGQKKPRWIGWHTGGIGGARTPSVDIHTCWEKNGDSVLTTALIPMPDDKDIIIKATDLSRPEDAVSGCNLIQKDKTDITYLAAQKTATLKIDNLTAKAETLLLVKTPKKTPCGIALGVKEMKVAGKKVSVPPNFEFTLSGNNLKVTSEIKYPDAPDVLSVQPDHGLFEKPIKVEVTHPKRPGAELRYTTDGSTPDLDSKICKGSILIDKTCDLKIRPFRKKQASGETVVKHFDIIKLPPVPPLPQVKIADLEPKSVKVGAFSLTRNKCCYKGAPLTIEGKTYKDGISVHAKAEITYALKPAYQRFVALVGLDDITGGKGHIIFKVLADGKLLTQSPLVEGTAMRYWYLDCKIPKGAKKLTLQVVGGPAGESWAMADWIHAGFITDKK